MAYPKFWTSDQVDAVLTTESRQKARDLFLATHQPFRQIRQDFSREGGPAGAFIDERELRSVVQAGRTDAHNRLFLIVGEAGSGKSELCQWLEYQVDTERRLPVHIPRSMTSAAHVVGLLRERLGHLRGRSALARTPLRDQAQYIAMTTRVLLYEHGSAHLTPIDAWATALTSQSMLDALLAHLEAANDGRWSHAPLTDRSEIDAVCAAAGVRDGLASEAAMVALRRLVARAIEQTAWVGDVRSLLADLAASARERGVRPLLLLEDVTAFQLLGDRLLDYLLDLSSGTFDAVIGVTGGYERTRLADVALAQDLTHVHQRLQGRYVLTDESGRAYGFEENLVAFAASYLRALRPTPGTLNHDNPAADPLYPFTETSLRRALLSLHEDGSPRQTPRLFLQHVLRASLLSDDIPPLALDRSPFLRQPPILARSDALADPALQSVLRWYGEVGERHVTLDARVLAAWDMAAPPHLIHDGRLTVERAYVPIMVTPTATSAPPLWDEQLRELQHWLGEGGLYPSREILKRGVERALLSLGDPRSLVSRRCTSAVRAEITYARGDERVPIVLGRESGDQPSTDAYVKVQVLGSPHERVILEELAYVALSGEPPHQVCQNIALTIDWTQSTWDAYHADIHALFTRRIGMNPEQVIWLTWRLIGALRGCHWLRTPPLTLPPDAVPAVWSEAHHPALASAAADLLGWADTAQRLMIGRFALHETWLDQEALATTDGWERAGLIAAAAAIPLRSLKTLPFKIRPTGQNLYGLLAALQRYCQYVCELDIPALLARDADDLAARLRRLDAQRSVSQSDLLRAMDELRRRAGEVGLVWQERWEAPIAYLREAAVDDIPALREALVTAIAALHDAPDGDIWSYHRLSGIAQAVTGHRYWEATTTARSIGAALLQAARGHYRRDGHAVTATRDYRELLGVLRQIDRRLAHD